MSALDVVGGQCYLQAVCPRERRGTYCVIGLVGPRPGLDGCGKRRHLLGFDP